MLDGRVKTLHPRIHAGILADRRKPEHVAQLAEHGIEPFDLVVVNLYPFRETVASGAGRRRRDREDRHRRPGDGPRGREELRVGRRGRRPRRATPTVARRASRPRAACRSSTRRALAAEAFAHTAAYDAAVAGWFALQDARRRAAGVRRARVREGRRPPVRREPASARRALRRGRAGPGCSAARRCSRARRCRSTTGSTSTPRSRSRPTAPPGRRRVIVKHNNPCGAAVAGSLAASYAARVRVATR